MLKKRLQVFVSSTFRDLRNERQAAVEAILTAGHIPAGMELFTAGDQTQLAVIQQWIDESDVFLLILGGRYGSIEPATGKSYTHLEFEYAREREKPMFAVVIEEDHLKERVRLEGMDVYETEHPQKLKAFRELVVSRVVHFWRDPRDIKLAIMAKMGEFSRRDELRGWIPGDQAVNAGPLAEEIARLTRENAQFRDQLSQSAGYVREQLSETVDSLIRLKAENDSLFYVPQEQRDPLYYQKLSANSQMAAALSRRSVSLAKQQPDALTEVEYAVIAQGLAIAGDMVPAEEFWRRAVEVSTSEYYRIVNNRAFADFLFNQGKHEAGRAHYRQALAVLDDASDYALVTNGYTHQMWMVSEASHGIGQQAQEHSETAERLIAAVSQPHVRQSSLDGLMRARAGLGGTLLPRRPAPDPVP